jgi:serine kinase of HPr protein (carbohydrate metabolism regulator)
MPTPKQLAINLALHATLFIVYGIGFLMMLYCFLG